MVTLCNGTITVAVVLRSTTAATVLQTVSEQFLVLRAHQVPIFLLHLVLAYSVLALTRTASSVQQEFVQAASKATTRQLTAVANSATQQFQTASCATLPMVLRNAPCASEPMESSNNYSTTYNYFFFKNKMTLI